MGKMKEIFMEEREQEVDQEQIEQASVFDSGIMCPNCFKANLIEFSQHDLYCESCGQEFIKVENSIRFK